MNSLTLAKLKNNKKYTKSFVDLPFVLFWDLIAVVNHVPMPKTIYNKLLTQTARQVRSLVGSPNAKH